APSHAEHKRQPASAGALAVRIAGQYSVARAHHQLRHQRLEEILDDAGVLELAIETDVVAVTDHEYAGIGVAHVGKVLQRLDGIVNLADVHDQEARGGAVRKLLDGDLNVTAHDHAVGDAKVGEA